MKKLVERLVEEICEVTEELVEKKPKIWVGSEEQIWEIL